MRRGQSFLSALIFGSAVLPALSANAQTFQELHGFSGPPDGGLPQGGLIEGKDGNLYGSTFYGGSFTNEHPDGLGTVFKMTPSGALTVLASFDGTNGMYPQGALVEASDGNFYGACGDQGEGRLFKMTPAGTLSGWVGFSGDNGTYP